MDLLNRTKLVTLMPQGNTPGEAEATAAFQASQGDYSPVEIDNIYPTAEITERTLIGKIVDLGKRVVSHNVQREGK